jgi:transposase-like protein
MIVEEKVFSCPRCGSASLIKNGKNRDGNQQDFCQDYRNSGVLNPENSDTGTQKEHLLAAYRERPNLRGITRLLGISRNFLSRWLRKVQSNPNLEATLMPAQDGDILEFDEMWSFVRFSKNKGWLWNVMCRGTR